jgi:glycosyltransferase involved in cell wall biosynthesis
MQRSDTRVVHITTVHHPQDPRIVRKELCTLAEAGYDAYLIAQNDTSEEGDFSFRALPEGAGRAHRLLIQREAYREAVALDADCYHVHDPELIPLARVLQGQTQGRIIYDMHEDYRWHGPIVGRAIRGLERWCFQWVDHVVVANAPHVSIAASAGAPTTRIANYYKPPVAEERRRPRSLPGSGPIRAIYTGVMGDGGGRGLSRLIDLAGHMEAGRLDARLRLVGVCYVESDRRRAERRIRREHLDDVIERVGWDAYVPWEELVQHYAEAHVGVVLGTDHPNQVEKIPTKFYEYLHYGLPILCSDFPVWRRFVETHECGAVVPPEAPGRALDVIQHWHRHPDVYRQRSEAALQAAQEYQWKSMGRRLVQLYDDLLRSTG